MLKLQSEGHKVYTPSRGDDDIYRRNLGHVIYAIGLTADFRQRPYDTVKAHVSMISELLQQGDFKSLLYLSSTRVYARAKDANEEDALTVLPQDASDLYNLSKLMGESLCLQDNRNGVRVARLSNVVGGDDAESENFVPSLMREALRGRIVLQTNPNSAKDYIHVDDVVELLPRIAIGGCERLYNVASGVQTTHAQWVTQIMSKYACAVEVAPAAATVSFVPIDISRIKIEFNFQPRPVLSILDSDFM